MNAQEVYTAMFRGAVLCMQYRNDCDSYWLEPTRVFVPANVA
jgi:hypothetical protein